MATAKTPAVKKAGPGTSVVSIQERLKAEVATIQDRIGAPGGDVIAVTQDKMFKLPDGTKHPGPMDVVIVDFVASSFFYEGAFDKDNISPPACFALGTNPSQLVASENSPVRQSDSCAGCPMNQWGSDGKGKACKNGRLLAMLPLDADNDTPVMILKVSPTAIKAFDSYVAAVARSFQLPPLGVVTEISFDDASSYASLRFKNPRPNENIELAFQRRDEARKRLLTEPDVSSYDAAPPPPPKKTAARGGAAARR